MNKSFSRKIDDFEGSFELKQNTLVISLKSFKVMLLLVANYSKDNLPQKIQSIFGTPDQLYDVLEGLDKNQMRVSEKQELVLLITIGKTKKEYVLPLQQAEISAQAKLIHEHQSLKELSKSALIRLKQREEVVENLRERLIKEEAKNKNQDKQIKQLRNELANQSIKIGQLKTDRQRQNSEIAQMRAELKQFKNDIKNQVERQRQANRNPFDLSGVHTTKNENPECKQQ